MRRLGEDEELVFETDLDLEAELLGARENAAQNAAWADRLELLGELRQEQEIAGLGRNLAAGVGQDAHSGVGITRVPAGHGDIVVELVVGVPTQHHVAEAKAALERRLELVDVDVLAAQDAVDVVDTD